MRIPLTKYGLPQVAVVPGVILALMVFTALGVTKYMSVTIVTLLEVILCCLLIFSLSFFRDPHRVCPDDKTILLAPADGKITDITTIKENSYTGKETLRIGIFLSIFNTHINRSPCNSRVEEIIYKKGQYKNALNPESSRVNESNEIRMIRTDNPTDKLAVKQISGAIARRIVCAARQGRQLAAGEKFGMIKFGSRTELYVACRDSRYRVECMVMQGDKVKAGLTPLVRYVKCES
jgi:phosphatidylserine decarboxylase